MKERILKCKDCGKEYVTTAPNSKYCLSCSNSRKGNEKIMIEPKYKRMKERKMICKICGKEYTTSAGLSKYCPGCMIAAKKITRMKYERKKEFEMAKKKEKEKVTEKVDMVMNEKQVKGDNNTRICAICGKEFQSSNHKKMTCSYECSRELHNKRNRERKKKERMERIVTVEKKKIIDWDEMAQKMTIDFQHKLIEFAVNNWTLSHVYMLEGAIKCVLNGEEKYPIGVLNDEKTYPIGGEQDGSSKKDGKESVYSLHG